LLVFADFTNGGLNTLTLVDIQEERVGFLLALIQFSSSIVWRKIRRFVSIVEMIDCAPFITVKPSAVTPEGD